MMTGFGVASGFDSDPEQIFVWATDNFSGSGPKFKYVKCPYYTRYYILQYRRIRFRKK